MPAKKAARSATPSSEPKYVCDLSAQGFQSLSSALNQDRICRRVSRSTTSANSCSEAKVRPVRRSLALDTDPNLPPPLPYLSWPADRQRGPSLPMLLPRSSRLLARRRILSGAASSSTASFSPPPKGSPAPPSTAPSLSSQRRFWSMPIALKSVPLPEHRQASSLPTLTELFDRPSLSSTSSALAPTGLFSQPALTSPDSLPSLAAHVVSRVQLILARLHRAPSAGHAELELVVKNFDRLSDLLCGVIDMCEAIVTLHPDKKWRRKAEETHEGLCRLMNEMNVDVRLYDVRCLLRPPLNACAGFRRLTFPCPCRRSKSLWTRLRSSSG